MIRCCICGNSSRRYRGDTKPACPSRVGAFALEGGPDSAGSDASAGPALGVGPARKPGVSPEARLRRPAEARPPQPPRAPAATCADRLPRYFLLPILWNASGGRPYWRDRREGPPPWTRPQRRDGLDRVRDCVGSLLVV